MLTLFHERAEGHGLCERPVDGPVLDHLGPGLEDPLEAAVDLEVGRVGRALGEPLADVRQGLLVDAGRGGLETGQIDL